MARLQLKNVSKIYDDGFKAVDNLSLEINDGEFVVLVGPSGCGKSTTLRMIAGLEEISAGEIYIGDRLVNSVAPGERDIAMVFQSYALYPDKTVYKNMAFALERRRVPKEEIRKRVMNAAEILGIEALLERKPKALSGGQRQRVALGRAIVREPQVFLFDEPLSNLDAKLRTRMRREIAQLHRKTGGTFIYVTHDQTEAMTLGDRVVVMNEGVVRQADTPERVYSSPADVFTASFIGSPEMNFLSALTYSDTKGSFVSFGKDIVRLSSNIPEGRRILLGIRPEDVMLISPSDKAFSATVEMTENRGDEKTVFMKFGQFSLTAKAPQGFSVNAGEEVSFVFNENKIHIFDAVTEKKWEKSADY